MKEYINDLIKENDEFNKIIENIVANETVQKMKDFKQHYETTCFDHCCQVAYYCYLFCKKFNLDYTSATRAAMLHDLFLYDWRIRRINKKGLHAFTHGKLACQNACELFDLNEKEKDMITKHMWPVTIAFPKSIEGFVLTFVDKYCAISETFEVLRSRLFMKSAFRYAYLFLCLLVIK